jgi:hypothetical protein
MISWFIYGVTAWNLQAARLDLGVLFLELLPIVESGTKTSYTFYSYKERRLLIDSPKWSYKVKLPSIAWEALLQQPKPIALNAARSWPFTWSSILPWKPNHDLSILASGCSTYFSNNPSRASRFGKSVRNYPDMIAHDDCETGFRLDLSQRYSSSAAWSQDITQN